MTAPRLLLGACSGGSGSLAEAVLASARVPGIFPPMVLDGELHVDGGLIDNVPVDVMKSFCWWWVEARSPKAARRG